MRVVGKKVEDLVSVYLKKHGLDLVASNYRYKFGEIDLIMRDRETLVFIEVRYRKSSDYGDGVVTVNKRKQDRIKKAAASYLQKNNLYDKIPCRFDIVAVSGGSQKRFHWVKDAFWDKW